MPQRKEQPWNKRVPPDVKAEWEMRLAQEGLGEDVDDKADTDAALASLGMDAQTLHDLRNEILMYLVTREETFGGHERAVRRLAQQFSMQDRELAIEAAIRDQEAVMEQLQRAVRDTSARTRSERTVVRTLQEQYPDIPPEVIDAAYDRYGRFSGRAM